MGNQAMEIRFKFPKWFQCAANFKKHRLWSVQVYVNKFKRERMEHMEMAKTWHKHENNEYGKREQQMSIQDGNVGVKFWFGFYMGQLAAESSKGCGGIRKLSMCPLLVSYFDTQQPRCVRDGGWISWKGRRAPLSVKRKEGSRIDGRSERLILPLWGYNWITVAPKPALRSQRTASGRFPWGCWGSAHCVPSPFGLCTQT